MAAWRYAKGAHYERELLHMLQAEGFKVIRAAGSGVEGDAPDLVALKTTRKLGLECKAHENAVYLEKEKFSTYLAWEQATGVPVFLAWKVKRKQWRFFPLSALRETAKSFTVGESDLPVGMDFDQLIAAPAKPGQAP
jgi:Holliday junction resolvase